MAFVEVTEVKREIDEDVVNNTVLPNKSRSHYEKQFNKFKEWCDENDMHDMTEKVLLTYFELQKKKYKPSTLWATYSMLRSCLSIYNDVDISKYQKLQTFLKRASEGYSPKKSKTLKEEDINRFLKEADDKMYLVMKVILLMGYNGACRREELTNMSIDDIEYKSDCILVSVPKAHSNVPRMFAVTNKEWIDIIKKYANLRPENVNNKRFFLTYRNGRCINSPIGINTMGKVSKEIAAYLKLPHPELFTGHCFRRSSVKHLANNGGDFLIINRRGRWKSTSSGEDYGEASEEKHEIPQILGPQQSDFDLPGCSSDSHQLDSDDQSDGDSHKSTTVEDNNTYRQNIVLSNNIPGVIINAKDSSNVTINVYNNCTIQSSVN